MLTTLDQDALAIGLLYQKAQTAAAADRVFHLGDAGHLLLKKKESLGYGQWSGWIKTNHGVLGFDERGARTLIHGAQWLASNWQLANKLEDIVTDPNASAEDLATADQIRQLISGQFQPAVRGTLGRRKQNEWYTPRHVISRARTVLGGAIDLDPASTEQAQETVRAREYFDKQQNGLRQFWFGAVWLNPPYAPPLIGKFVAKLLMEWDSGRITSCIALTHNYTDTIWFHDAVSAADAVCFTQGRIKFHEPGGAVANPTQGQAFFYFGRDVEAFKHEFGRVGFIVRPEPDSWSRRRVRDEQNRRAIDTDSAFS
jgi:hypothetical protein